MRSIRPEVPEELEEAVMRCLVKDRAQRFPTVSELARALAPFGSSSSQLHVDRASRVLGVTDVSLSGLPMSAPLRPSRATPNPPNRATIDSWGRTDDVVAAHHEPARSRTPLFVGLGLTIAALLAVVLFLGIREPSAPPSGSASVAAPPPPPASTIAPAPTPVALVPAPAEPQVLPSALAPEPGAPVVRPADSITKPKSPAPVPAVKAKAAPAATKAAGSTDLSDFGGRR
jgi:hypothetical protein